MDVKMKAKVDDAFSKIFLMILMYFNTFLSARVF